MRSVVERTARVVAIVLLAWSAWAIGRQGAVETNLSRALANWTTPAVRVTLDSTPSPVDRDWLVAMRQNGVPVEWSWRRMPPTPRAVAATPLADPAGATRVAVAAPGGTSVTLADRLGPIDTGRAASGGLTVVMPTALNSVMASGARTGVTDSLILRPLLVLGTVSWETKFVVRSLEERGWQVDARLVLAPTRSITQGRQSTLDTSNYAAIIAVDSGARSAAEQIKRYAQEGGGVIVAGSAIRYIKIPTALEVRDDTTWRLRMDSGGGPARHRDLWAGLVAQVAYAPKVRLSTPDDEDPAPVAATVARLGPPTLSGGRHQSHWPGPEVWFGLLAAALLVDWASRRLRGAP